MVFGSTLAWLAAGYALIALIAVLRFRAAARPDASATPKVSVLKPLCGEEPRLYENLRSFCTQDYPSDCFQLVFGVRDAADPAIAVVGRLKREYPDRSIDLVVDSRLHGTNYKVSNLINILARCRREVLIIADSDIAVGPDYLRRVVAPLTDERTGVVTCLYRGRPIAGFWSRLGALFIDDWFAPSVLVSQLFGSRDFSFGATIALRRSTLNRIGGLKAIADQLADDWWLGELARRQGLRTVLSNCVVTTDVVDADARALIDHELRWLRTIRSIQPLGYAFSVVTCSLPVAAIGVAVAHGALPALAGLSVTLIARLVLHFAQRMQGGAPVFSTVSGLWLLPLRDFLLFGVWCASFASRRVSWRQQEFSVGRDGAFHEVPGSPASIGE